MSIRESIDRAPMSRYQLGVIALCLTIILVEGYDLLLMAFSASAVAKEFSLNGAQIGLLLSSALIGMAVGSAFIAPLADRIGRRPMSLLAMGLVIVSMGFAAIAGNFALLLSARLVTGIGIGGLVASLPVIIAEFSPQRRRATMIAISTAGLPLGGVVGGFVAAAILTSFGWRATFVVGTAITLVLFLLVLFIMPESIDYLVARRPASAVGQVNRTLARMRLSTVDSLPEPEARAANRLSTAVFKGRNGVRSALLGFAFFVMMAAFYFANGWTPRLLEQSGLSTQQGISGGVLLNLGGAGASLVFGLLAVFFRSKTLTVIAFAGATVSFAAMTIALGSFATTLLVALAVGALIQACATGLFAIAPDCYPAAVRTTGVGWAVALGRLGGIAGPIVAGVLVDGGWAPPSLYGLFAIPLVLGGLAVLFLRLPGSRDDTGSSAVVDEQGVRTSAQVTTARTAS